MATKFKRLDAEQCTCKICNETFLSGKKLSFHTWTAHGLRAQEYTIKHVYNGIEPKCLECGSPVRYVSFSFKRYCKEHSYIGESQGGRVGGRIKKQWNKKDRSDIT